MPLRRYAEFGGRSSRREYWLFTLLYIVVAVIYVIGFDLIGLLPPSITQGIGLLLGRILMVIGIVGWLALLVPTVALHARRFHDQDKTAWLILLAFIPGVGTIVLLVFMAIEGTRGPNRYGPDPHGTGAPMATRA